MWRYVGTSYARVTLLRIPEFAKVNVCSIVNLSIYVSDASMQLKVFLLIATIVL